MASTSPTTETRKRPALREPYVWLLILFPALSVLGGVTTLIIAATTFDGLVTDDYYKRGKEINRVLARDQVALRDGLRAELMIGLDGNLVAKIDTQASRLPDDEVQLALTHATRTGFDQRITLQHAGGAIYRGRVQPLSPGKWRLQLSTTEWRLVATLHAPLRERYVLEAH